MTPLIPLYRGADNPSPTIAHAGQIAQSARAMFYYIISTLCTPAQYDSVWIGTHLRHKSRTSPYELAANTYYFRPVGTNCPGPVTVGINHTQVHPILKNVLRNFHFQ